MEERDIQVILAAARCQLAHGLKGEYRADTVAAMAEDMLRDRRLLDQAIKDRGRLLDAARRTVHQLRYVDGLRADQLVGLEAAIAATEAR